MKKHFLIIILTNIRLQLFIIIYNEKSLSNCDLKYIYTFRSAKAERRSSLKRCSTFDPKPCSAADLKPSI